MTRSSVRTRRIHARRGRVLLLSLAAVAAATVVPPGAITMPAAAPPLALGDHVSVRHEIERAIDRGLASLAAQQGSNGWWSTPEHPAVTALALTAFKGDPAGRYTNNESPAMRAGYRYLLHCVQADGGIHQSNLVTYNTSISMLALLAAERPDYDMPLRKAREFLVSLQRDFGEKGRVDTPFDGGVGYGSHYEHSDMGNTLAALEALRHTRYLVTDRKETGAPDLNWAAAIQFLQNCQNLPAYNNQPWASSDPKQIGGFVYYPGYSMAGSETNKAGGRVALRSYGSISYSGLLSYIYADLKRDDPRVRAVFDWLRRNYTLEENPGMGPQGLYYYYHTMTKALSAYGVDALEMPGGAKLDWRKELALRLIDLQQHDGSWANESGRWWEKDTALVTSYALLSLERIWRGL